MAKAIGFSDYDCWESPQNFWGGGSGHGDIGNGATREFDPTHESNRSRMPCNFIGDTFGWLPF